MRDKAKVRLLLSTLLLGSVPSWAVTVNGFNSDNIGSNVGGTTTYNSSNGTYTIVAGGLDIEGTSDNFHFLYQTLSSQGRITARINSVTNTHDWTKVGVMVRQNIGANSANAMFLLRPQLGSAGQYRSTAGAGTVSTWQETPPRYDDFRQTNPYRTRYLRPAKWLSAIRQGNTVTTYSSDDGLCWNLRTKETIGFSGSVLMGIALTSNHATNKATAQISNLSVTTSVPADINANCPRTQKDGDLAAPTNWIVSPTSAGWAVSTTNPEPNLISRTCISERNPFPRVKGADAPACPKEEITHAWAKSGYAFNTGSWIYNKTSRLGNGTGGINQSTFWLRREVYLSQTQINNLMFWGRWNNSVSIYVNGKLATNTYSSGLADRYHYLGMNDTARAALLPNQNNVIAIRVECANNDGDFIKNCTDATSDFGLTQNQALAAMPVVKPVSTSDQTLADIFTQYTKEQGAMGGTFAEYKQNVLVNQRWLGWANRSLTTPLAQNPMMRLASVDKAVGNAVTQYLYSLGILHPDTKVFGGVLNITPIPGKTFGQNVLDITVEDLRTHKSGITNVEIGSQGFHDELAFIFNVDTNQITSEHLARFYASQDACNWAEGDHMIFNCSIGPGVNAPYTYSNNGHGLLRYLAEVATGKPYEQILQEMGTTEIVVARENPAQRPAREPGYMIVDREPTVRWWIPLEKGIGFSASASGLLRFLMDNGGSGGGGAMDGTRSGHWAHYDPNPANREGHAFIWNSDYAGSNRFGDLRAIRSGAKYGSCDPTAGTSSDIYRMQNSAPTDNKFLLTEPVNGDSSLRQAMLENHGWATAKWRFEPVSYNGQTVYRIANSSTNQYMQAQGTQSDAPVVAQALPTGTLVTRAYWRIVKVGDYMRLENVAAPGSFLHTEGSHLPRIRNYSDAFWTTRWYICT